jgi:hypothetical protein
MQKKCARCGEFKPATSEYFSQRKTRLDSWCKSCYAAKTRTWAKENQERKRLGDKVYRERMPEEKRERKRAWNRKYAQGEEQKQAARAHNRKLKARAMEGYGGAFCKCCGEDMLEFLTLDHINVDGKAQRQELGGRGKGGRFYKLLADKGFPPGLQVLCMNCNWARHWSPNQLCPHEIARQELTQVPSAYQAP